MPFFPPPSAERFGYHLDGTAVYGVTGLGVSTALTVGQITNIADEQASTTYTGVTANGTPTRSWIAFIFPDERAITKVWIACTQTCIDVEVSTNSTTGANGTWTDVTPVPTTTTSTTNFSVVARTGPQTLTGAANITGIRFGFTAIPTVYALHLYGTHDVTSVARLAIWHPTSDVPLTLQDYDEVRRGTNESLTFRVKNCQQGGGAANTTNNVTVSATGLTIPSPSVTHEYSIGGGAYSASLNIGSLTVGSISGVITGRVTVGATTQMGVYTHYLRATTDHATIKTGVAGSYMNIGFDTTATDRDVQSDAWVIQNVGFDTSLIMKMADEWVLEGDVDTSTPTPYIWFLRPTSGRAGDGFAIYGFGFGSSPSTYNGVPYMIISSSDIALGVVSWSTHAADALAYGEDRYFTKTDPIFRSGLYWEDTFSGTTLDSRWTIVSGTWSVSGGNLNGNGTGVIMADEAADVQVEVTIGTTSNSYILLRRYSSSHFIRFDPADGNLREHGVFGTDVRVDGPACSTGDTIKIIASGMTLTLYRNGTLIGSGNIQDPNLITARGVGFNSDQASRTFPFIAVNRGLEAVPIDMEHQVIEVTVPVGAVAPGHYVKVVTNGP